VTFAFHPDAEVEFNESIDYYESCGTGLGYDFSLEVLSSIEAIVPQPLAWPVVDLDVRRCLVNRFPFGILYAIEGQSIFVLAIMHLHRKPGYWRDRR
jgi:toxin ParE1/3/4